MHAMSATPTRGPYLFEKVLPFSAIAPRKAPDGRLAWNPWAERCVRIASTGELIAMNPAKAQQDVLSNTCPRHKKLLLGSIVVSAYTIWEGQDNACDAEQPTSEIGLAVKCQTLEEQDSFFRVLLDKDALAPLLDVFARVAKSHNVAKLRFKSFVVCKPSAQDVLESQRSYSIMRRATALPVSADSSKQRPAARVLAKRKAFHYLPVLLGCDQRTGGLWLAAGSTGVMITAIVCLEHSYLDFFSTRSATAQRSFDVAWAVMLFAGILATLACLLFLRAFQDDPRKAPLLPWKHAQNDELLASWLLLAATVPFIASVLILLSSSGLPGLFYLIALGFAVPVAASAGLFVHACYPSDPASNPNVAVSLLQRLGAVLSARQQRHFFANDWLSGAWLLLWSNVGVAGVSALLLIYEVVRQDHLYVWIIGSSLIEASMYAVGSAYLVAGSYAETTRHVRPTKTLQNEAKHDEHT